MEYFKDCMTQEELRAKYRELCVKMHPDRNQENPNATAEFQEMQQQYEERKAELNGDYSKARKGRERREREERERTERERRERERRKVEQVIEQARLNRQKSFRDYKTGDYIYAMAVNNQRHSFNPDSMTGDDLLRAVLNEGTKDECVVVIELVVELTAFDILNANPSKLMPEGVWGGWEVIQTADPASGLKKAKRVAKVIMFRSEQYCFYGNPMGDMTIEDYYMPVGYGVMFQTHLDRILTKIRFEQQEKARREAERVAKIEAEQRPMIEAWGGKLIELSRGLTQKERETVAVANLKTMLKQKFPGTTFKVTGDRSGYYEVRWEDGPTYKEVDDVRELFDWPIRYGSEFTTPWEERYGRVLCCGMNRKMGTLTKAKILQQLGQVTTAFRESDINEDVELSDFDWMMLHAMVGIDVNGASSQLCISTLHADGRRTVRMASAILFIFNHTSYKKATKAKKKVA